MSGKPNEHLVLQLPRLLDLGLEDLYLANQILDELEHLVDLAGVGHVVVSGRRGRRKITKARRGAALRGTQAKHTRVAREEDVSVRVSVAFLANKVGRAQNARKVMKQCAEQATSTAICSSRQQQEQCTRLQAAEWEWTQRAATVLQDH